ncbi:TonB-dependent receptor domain-containing protein [Sphingopyxis sp. MWB1]|uniref:TonB-dependent receptor domain-containing protein n=1 Tax=Sphingopyxis sp. MWB1 TaxID=1537715 RepID=UPI0013627AB2|nr:TonB-dependent receptor [Sphingopyxis sp. MWB1]
MNREIGGRLPVAARWLSLVLGVSMAAMTWPTFAQEDRAGGLSPDEEMLDAIVVTGSRIQRSGIDAPTPTVAVGAEIIEAKGITNVADLLNELPQISTGLSNANTSFSFGNIGLNQVDMRNLGVRRTLTLVNGRRRAGTPDDSNFLAFDLSAIPTALIDRVEVQTGGTSAVYGADAVAGVINLILKDDFEGVEAYAQYGMDNSGDYDALSYGLTAGTNYGRGNAVLHVSRMESGRLSRRDRGLGGRYAFVPNPANTGPDDGIPARIPVRDLKFAYFGLPTPTSYLPFGPGGSWTDVIFDPALQSFRPLDAGPDGVLGGAYSRVEGGTQNADTLIAPLERTSVYAKADYDIADNITLFSEAIFADINARDRIGAVFDSFSTNVSIDNPFMPEAVRQGLIAAGEDSMGYARQHDEFGMRGTDINRKYYSIAAGLEGRLGNSWTWSAVYEFGKSQTTNRNLNDRLDAHWFEASDAIRDPLTGDIVCRSEEARARGCVPVNIFGKGTISQAAVDYIRASHSSTTDTSQTLVQGLVAGDLFQLPAGAVKMSAGIEYRKDAIDFRPSYVWENALGFFASQFSPVAESNDVREAFAEVLVPVLSDKPFFHSLELEAAYRLSDYQRAGTVDSWKLAGSWSPVRDIRFRVTRATAVRAPSLGELFNPGSRGAAGLSDPCDPNLLDSGTDNRRANCLALGLDPVSYNPDTRRVTTLVFSTGNPDLDVEKANTFTAGVVLRPRFLPGFALSADYYNIKLDGGIERIGAQQTVDNCVDLPTLDNQFCELVKRKADGNLREVLDSYINVSAFKVEGVDFELSYNRPLADIIGGDGDLGQIGIQGIASYLRHNIFIDKDLVTGEETAFDGAGESGNPKFRALINANYRKGPFQLNWSSRFVGKSVTNNQLADPQEDVGKYYHIPSIWYHDMSLAYDTPMNVRLTAGINNLFDTGPRDHPFTERGNLSFDNLIGRYFFFGAKWRFGGH